MLLTIHVASSNDVRTGVHRLIFYPNNSPIIVRVRIIDDKLVEGNEAFGVRLIVPDHHKVNGVKLGNTSFAKVVIKDGTYVCSFYYFVTMFYNNPIDDKPSTIPSTKPPTTQPPCKIIICYLASQYVYLYIAVEKMSVKVQFESSSYQVLESCTLLSVTLVVIGEVKKPFTVGVLSTPKDYSMLSGESTYVHVVHNMDVYTLI